jgi:predicted transcriptional regulator
MLGFVANNLGLIKPSFFEEVEREAEEVLGLLVINLIKNGYSKAEQIYEQTRTCAGLPTNALMIRHIIDNLEKKGLIKREGNHYELTEEGEKHLKNNLERMNKMKEVLKRVKLAKAVGIPMALYALTELSRNLEKLSPQEREEIMNSLGTAVLTIKRILAKHVE